jgi:hypothetical protein
MGNQGSPDGRPRARVMTRGQSDGPRLGASRWPCTNTHEMPQGGKAGHLSESRAALPDRKEPRAILRD